VIVTGRTVDPHTDLAAYQERTGVRIITIDRLRRDPSPAHDIAALYELRSLIRKMGPDIVHTNCSKAGVLGRLAAFLAGKKAIVHTPHGHLFYGYYGGVVTRLIVLAEKLTAPLAKRIVLLTERSVEDHVSRGVARREKFVAISPGIDLSKYKPDPKVRERFRKKHGITGDRKIVGWAGRLTDIKSPQLFLEAASIVKDKEPDAVFAILGEGALRQELERRVGKLGLKGRVLFLGKSAKIQDFMASIDGFVLTSSNEGLGIVLLEAMATGVPVIGTAVGGVPEVLDGGRAGLLVRPDDYVSMARCMLSLLKDNHISQELAAKGRKRARDYAEERTVEKYIRLYGEFLSDGNGKKMS
jgi:glycosyltransferase involved in cell wall biosynthesis